ncbi:TfoX/Sxy family transcriptional regulator of competence genes [Sphingomonas jinjuensis]|uniref:TfoX/Sxy family transcriptional regulator of competence genes n=1 Tax=Sphingomonas jinjuensis TaxID=535907 RepID=A0A840FKI5_9SPHN|nr:TfoX/Sxy family protein [Sphingomonas jinjuensis]MBB4153835.1 TfoX/Sxy family transcriptional regulator of competence genes [Sphingomonas jinjuensis]
MASQRKTVDFLVEQLSGAGAVTAKPMFGEYGVYCDGTMIAIVADDQLFVKPTAGGRAHAAGAEEAPPYPGAKPSLLIDPDRWDDADWMSALAHITADELPPPKAGAPKRAKTR